MGWNITDLYHVELCNSIFLHTHGKRNPIFLYEHFGYKKKLLSSQKHDPEAFSKGSLNNGKQTHWRFLKQRREKQLFSILIAEQPIRKQNIKQKTPNQQANINFCNSYKLNSREKNPWSAPRPLVSNWTESFRRILICFRGYHQSYYPPDPCHGINQTFICNSISMEELWQKLTE